MLHAPPAANLDFQIQIFGFMNPNFNLLNLRPQTIGKGEWRPRGHKSEGGLDGTGDTRGHADTAGSGATAPAGPAWAAGAARVRPSSQASRATAHGVAIHQALRGLCAGVLDYVKGVERT